jgi:ABC-type oligopeptide transport system substrate-binding subunit
MREIRWQILSDAEQAVLRLKGGQLDFTNLMPQQYHRYVEEAAEGSDFRGGRFTTKPYSPLRYFYIGWNERRPPLDDARVRRALSMAANREEMLKTCFFGLGRFGRVARLSRSPVLQSRSGADAVSISKARRSRWRRRDSRTPTRTESSSAPSTASSHRCASS